MDKYYKTAWETETGQKFHTMHLKRADCIAAQHQMAEKYGFTAWRAAYWCVEGGLSSCIFEKKPNPQIWLKQRGPKFDANEYRPRLNTPEGRKVADEIKAMPTISRGELNACVGFIEPFKSIGYTWNEDVAGFSVNAGWEGLCIPKDCTEITGTEYERIQPDHERE